MRHLEQGEYKQEIAAQRRAAYGQSIGLVSSVYDSTLRLDNISEHQRRVQTCHAATQSTGASWLDSPCTCVPRALEIPFVVNGPVRDQDVGVPLTAAQFRDVIYQDDDFYGGSQTARAG